MVAFWWVFSIVMYLSGLTFTLKKLTWLMVEDDSRACKPSELDAPDWFLGCMASVFWPAFAPFFLIYKAVKFTATHTGIASWIDQKPLPRAERKAARLERKATEQQARLDKIKEDTRTAERELAAVNADLQRIQGEAGYCPDGRPKYGIPGHRGW